MTSSPETSTAQQSAQDRPFTSPAGRELIAWSEATPGGADKLIEVWKSRVEHENRIENREAWLAWVGAGCGLVVAISFLMVTYKLVMASHAVAGTILGTVDLVALVSAFVIGVRTTRSERQL